jgi:hypothetical protein
MYDIGIVDSANGVIVPGNGKGGRNFLPTGPVKKYFFLFFFLLSLVDQHAV